VSSIPGKVRIAILGALVVAGLLVPAGSASAQVELNGIWAPFTRCPVDNPAMLAADGENSDPVCIANSSPNGSIKLGNSTQTTGATNLQLGAVADGATGEFSLISPPGGALIAEPVNVQGGLLGLMCPSNIPLVTAICDGLVGSPLNAVTAQVEPAGEPSNFSTAAGTVVGEPIITLPVKVHLQNPVLGPNCYIGSNNDPIVLRPRNTTEPVLDITAGQFDGTPVPDGELAPLVDFNIRSTQGDNTFAVPAARGCGLLGVLDPAVNLQQGLPSPAGNNNLVLNDASADVMTESIQGPVSGQQFSDAWHSAVLP
jgi:hypothetical protein